MSGSLYHILGWRQNGCGKKGVLVTKGTDRGWLSYFFQKSFFGQGVESVAEMEIGKHSADVAKALESGYTGLFRKRRLPFVESRLVHRREPAMAGG